MQTPLAMILRTKNQDIHDIDASGTIREAIDKMHELKIGSLLVRRDKKMVGIITERDLAWRVLAQSLPTDRAVSEVMTTPVATLRFDQSIKEALKIMQKTHCRHLPVVDKNDVVGVLAMGDLLRHLTADYEAHIEFLEAYIRGR